MSTPAPKWRRRKDARPAEIVAAALSVFLEKGYAATRLDAVPDWMHDRRDALMALFCVDQTLIHLEAAQRGLWVPGPGLGFLGGWRQLLDGAAP